MIYCCVNKRMKVHYEVVEIKEHKENSIENKNERNGNGGNNGEEGEFRPSSKKTPLPHIPNNCSPKNILEVSSLVSSSSHALDTPTSYHLPFKHNRGKPLVQYSPNVEEKESKYLDTI